MRVEFAFGTLTDSSLPILQKVAASPKTPSSPPPPSLLTVAKKTLRLASIDVIILKFKICNVRFESLVGS